MKKSVLRVATLATLGFILSGCVDPQAILQASVDACSRYGFSQGTEQYAICVQQENARRTDQKSRDVDAFAKSLQNLANTMK